MRNRAKTFCDVVSAMTDTYRKKNNDYGGSFTKLYDEFGAMSSVIKLTDKLERFKALTVGGADQQVQDEAITDTLMDMANYAVMTIVEMMHKKESFE